ncbi:MAG: DUF2971 domain-containing protein [Prevotella sp.]|nr:DUF2971 domain-containing protein [Prevotella sp.]
MAQICHYTTVEAFQEMLKNISLKDGEPCLTFWASSIHAMNDPSEFVYGYKLLRDSILPAIEKELRIQSDSLKLSQLWKYRVKTGNSDEWDKQLVDSIYENHNSPFIISFSRKKDFLPMWTTYSNKGRGICLCFDNNKYAIKYGEVELLYGIHTKDASYDEVDKIISNAIKGLYEGEYQRYKHISDKRQREQEMILSLARCAIVAAPYYKHEAYKYENESRWIQFKDDNTEVKYRCSKQGRLIPYIEIPIKLRSLEEVIVGPCADSDSVIRALKYQLRQYGIENIHASTVPYREY